VNDKVTIMGKKYPRPIAVGIVLLLLTVGLCILFFVDPSSGRGIIPCPIYYSTHLYCPGCGTARALHSLLHLKFYQAFRFNPAVVILLPFLTVYCVIRGYEFVTYKENVIDRRIPYQLLIANIIALFVFGILRNLPFFPFNLLAPTQV